MTTVVCHGIRSGPRWGCVLFLDLVHTVWFGYDYGYGKVFKSLEDNSLTVEFLQPLNHPPYPEICGHYPTLSL